MGCQLCNLKKRYEKAKSRKKLEEQFSVTGTIKSCSCYFLFVFIQYIFHADFIRFDFVIVIFSFLEISRNFRSNYYCRCHHKARCFKHCKSSSKNYYDFSTITDLKSATLGTSKVSR